MLTCTCTCTVCSVHKEKDHIICNIHVIKYAVIKPMVHRASSSVVCILLSVMERKESQRELSFLLGSVVRVMCDRESRLSSMPATPAFC